MELNFNFKLNTKVRQVLFSQPMYVGDYTYDNGQKVNQFYVLVIKDEASSNVDQVVTIALFVVRDIVTLLVGIVLFLGVSFQLAQK